MTFSALSWSSALSGPTFAFWVIALVRPLLDPRRLTTSSSSGISSTDDCLLWVVLGESSGSDSLSVPGCGSKRAFLGASTPLPSFLRFHEPSRCSSRFALALLDIFETHLLEGRLASMVQVALGKGEIFEDYILAWSLCFA